MELQQLRIFEAVARHLNITGAANELGMSQPAVSQQLQKLERECGIKLCLRHNYGIDVTSEGRTFLPAVESILSQVNKINMEFRARTHRVTNRPFIVGASNMFSATVLPEILVDFMARYPSVDLVVEANSSGRIEELVQVGKIEAALISNPQHLPGCEYEPYLEHEAVAFVAPNNPLSRKSLTLEELCGVPLVVRRGSSAVMEIRNLGYRPKFAAQFGAIEAVKSAVVGGMGVGILFRSRLEAELKSGTLCVIDVPELRAIKLKSYVVYSTARAHSQNLSRFLDVVRPRRASAMRQTLV